MAEELTYEALMNQWRKELRSTTLAKIDAHFYQALDDHLRTLLADYQREHAVNPSSARAMILQDELRNLQRAREDFYDLRERKIAISALIAARGGNPDRNALTKGELELYEELTRVFKDARRALLKRAERDANEARAAVEGPAATPPGPGVPPAPLDAAGPAFPIEAPALPAATAPAASPAPEAPIDAPKPRMRSGRVTVRIRENVPPFTGSDLRTYHLAAQDIVSLPRTAAKALASHGKAEILGE